MFVIGDAAGHEVEEIVVGVVGEVDVIDEVAVFVEVDGIDDVDVIDAVAVIVEVDEIVEEDVIDEVWLDTVSLDETIRRCQRGEVERKT